MELTFWQTSLAGALGGLVSSLVTPLLNDWLTRRFKRAEWQQNRDEWLLGKQARDIEEIVEKLNQFITTTSDFLRDQHIEFETCTFLLKGGDNTKKLPKKS